MSDILQRARDIAADQYIRLAMKRPNNFQLAVVAAGHIQRYSDFMREGHYDDDCAVQSAIIALRSVAS